MNAGAGPYREEPDIGAPGWRLLVPALLGLLAIALVAAPIFTRVPLVPQLPLLVVGAWALYQPRLMPPWLALLIGIATDLALALPVGLNGALLALTAFLLDQAGQTRQTRPFVMDWLLAGVIIAVYQLLVTEMAALQGTRWSLMAMVPQLLISWVLFPAVTRISAAAYGLLVRRP